MGKYVAVVLIAALAALTGASCESSDCHGDVCGPVITRRETPQEHRDAVDRNRAAAADVQRAVLSRLLRVVDRAARNVQIAHPSRFRAVRTDKVLTTPIGDGDEPRNAPRWVVQVEGMQPPCRATYCVSRRGTEALLITLTAVVDPTTFEVLNATTSTASAEPRLDDLGDVIDFTS